MWMCFKTGFLSIVHKDCKADELLVRARVAGHIEATFPNAKVRKTFGTDYSYRAVIKRKELGRVMTEMAHSYMADNFKNSVEDDDLHDAYTSVWAVMARMQETRPYAKGPTPAKGPAPVSEQEGFEDFEPMYPISFK
jgi:hypothetical protein